MLEPHSLKQRLLVLLKVLTPAKPPVINYQQSAPCKIRNREKNNTKLPSQDITQQILTADTHPPRELTAN
jgi:hypothetical protein